MTTNMAQLGPSHGASTAPTDTVTFGHPRDSGERGQPRWPGPADSNPLSVPTATSACHHLALLLGPRGLGSGQPAAMPQHSADSHHDDTAPRSS